MYQEDGRFIHKSPYRFVQRCLGFSSRFTELAFYSSETLAA